MDSHRKGYIITGFFLRLVTIYLASNHAYFTTNQLCLQLMEPTMLAESSVYCIFSLIKNILK